MFFQLISYKRIFSFVKRQMTSFLEKKCTMNKSLLDFTVIDSAGNKESYPIVSLYMFFPFIRTKFESEFSDSKNKILKLHSPHKIKDLNDAIDIVDDNIKNFYLEEKRIFKLTDKLRNDQIVKSIADSINLLNLLDFMGVPDHYLHIRNRNYIKKLGYNYLIDLPEDIKRFYFSEIFIGLFQKKTRSLRYFVINDDERNGILYKQIKYRHPKKIFKGKIEWPTLETIKTNASFISYLIKLMKSEIYLCIDDEKSKIYGLSFCRYVFNCDNLKIEI